MGGRNSYIWGPPVNTSQKSYATLSIIGIDVGKNSFYLVGSDELGAIVLRRKFSRGRVEKFLANGLPSETVDHNYAAQALTYGVRSQAAHPTQNIYALV